MELNIICTTVSAEVMLSDRTHSCVMPTEPMLSLSEVEEYLQEVKQSYCL